MEKRDKTLIAVTVILVLVLICAFLYDRNQPLLERSTGYTLTDDMEIVSMKKTGLMLNRSYFEAKISIPYEDTYSAYEMITSVYPYEGETMTYEEYKKFAASVFDKETLIPNPMPNTYIWVQGVYEENRPSLLHIVVFEGESEAYLYVYYSRK